MKLHWRSPTIWALLWLGSFPESSALAAAPSEDDRAHDGPKAPIRIESLSSGHLGEAPGAPPTLGQDQQGVIYELWIPEAGAPEPPFDPAERPAGDSRDQQDGRRTRPSW